MSHPYPMRYNPYHHLEGNPLSRKKKIALGVTAGVVTVGAVAAILFWPKKAQAAPVPTDTGDTKKDFNTRAPGHPPNPSGKSCYVTAAERAAGKVGGYDVAYWDEGGSEVARERIMAAFDHYGYPRPVGRTTMNDPGPDAALGGGDDIPNENVRKFQKDYNSVSRWGGWIPTKSMGGLDMDGFVGPCTLSGLKVLVDNLRELDGETWQGLVAKARQAGYRA